MTAATMMLAFGAAPTSAAPTSAAPRCGLSAKLVPSCGVLWGLYSKEIGGQSWDASYTGMERQVGRQFDIVKRYHDFSGTGPNGLFPNAKEQALGNDGRILYFAWTSILFGSRAHVSWSAIASGKYDQSVIVPVAEHVKAWNKKVFIDFDHEADSKAMADRGRPADYVAAYRHIVNVFDRVGATNVVWAWVLTGYTGHAEVAKALYPGDSYVDWIAWDPYNYYRCRDQPWRTPTETFNRWYNWLNQNGFGDKPYMLAEYGSIASSANPNAKGDWYRGVPAALEQLPNIKAVVIFNTHKVCDFRVHTSETALSGYKSAGNNHYVRGVSPTPAPPSAAPMASTRLQGDFDGDGRADLAAFVESSPSVVQLWMWRSTSATGGTPAMDTKELVWQGNGFNIARMRTMVGDVDGDGKADIAALTDRGNGLIAVYVWRSTGSPGQLAVAKQVELKAGVHAGWSRRTLRTTMADIDGDGRDDLVAFAGYAERSVGVWAWRSTAQPGSPLTVADSRKLWSIDSWQISKMRFAAGDMDGDQRDDLLGFFDVGGGLVRGWYLRALPGFDVADRALIREGTDAGWSVKTLQPLVADVDGDGKDEVLAFVGVAGEERLYAWRPHGAVGQAPDLGTKKLLWSDPAYDYWRLMPFAGDVNADGMADLGAFYDFEGPGVRSWIWQANGSTGSINLAAPTPIYDTYANGFATKTMLAS